MDLYKNLNLHKVEHNEGIKVNIKDDPKTSNEEYLKILKVEYLSNHWPVVSINLSLGDQTKIRNEK